MVFLLTTKLLGRVDTSNLYVGFTVLQCSLCHPNSQYFQVGVVGDAMSGKNCLLAALLRLWNLQGMLFIDGFDVLKIGLHELRKNVAVVSKVWRLLLFYWQTLPVW